MILKDMLDKINEIDPETRVTIVYNDMNSDSPELNKAYKLPTKVKYLKSEIDSTLANKIVKDTYLSTYAAYYTRIIRVD